MRKVRTATVFWLLELYALALALLQMPGGVRTDEAKYLLSIPYPHPPLVRSIMAFTTSMPDHEFFWRLVVASVTVQAVWLIFDLGEVLTRPRRMCLALSWLFAAPVVLQGGTVMMAVLAAVYGLVFVWFALHPKATEVPALIACAWLASLFTVYQSVLYAPLVLYALSRGRLRMPWVLAFFGLPLLLLALYSLTNPLALASMAHASMQDVPVPPLDRLFRVGWIWLLAGSAVVSLAGTVGILTSSRWDLVAAFGLTFGFVILTSQTYYAILLLPVFIGGTFLLLCRRRLRPGLFILAEFCCTAAMVTYAFPAMHPTNARSVMRELAAQDIKGPVLIDGPFGHEWEYESTVPVLKFSQVLSSAAEAKAQAFVCTKGGCDDDVNLDEWVRLPDAPIPVWLRR